MTYSQEPGNPNIRRTEAPNRGIGGGTIAAIAIAVVITLGILGYAITSRTTTASVNSPAFERSVPDSSTTGQSGTTNIPGRDRPSPTPAPR